MFFIGVFGVEDKEKLLGEVQGCNCKNCNGASLKVVKSYRYFHFFFLPLYKWNENYYALCEGCGMVYDIPKEKGDAMEKGEKGNITYWDLKPSERVNYRVYHQCSNCGSRLEEKFQYCPHCGNRL